MQAITPRRAALATVCALAAAACWALAAVTAKDLFDSVTPLQVSLARAALCCACFTILALVRPQQWPGRADVPTVLVWGVMLATTNGAYYLAVERISVGAAVSVQFLAPLFVLAWTAAVRRQRVPPLLWMAGIAAVAGAAAVSGLTGAVAVDALGLCLALAAAVSLAAYWLIGEGLLTRLPMVPLLASGFAVATAVWAFFEPPWTFPFEVLDARPGFLILVVGLLGTAVPYTFMSASQAVLPAGHVGVLASAEPAFAGLFAFALLGERLGPVQVVGIALLTAGLMGVQGARRSSVRLEALPEP